MSIQSIDRLPDWWCIENKYQEVRDWFAERYKAPEVRSWTSYTFIGYDESPFHNGVHGCSKNSFSRGNVEISFEDFKRLVLKQTPQTVNEYLIY